MTSFRKSCFLSSGRLLNVASNGRSSRVLASSIALARPAWAIAGRLQATLSRSDGQDVHLQLRRGGETILWVNRIISGTGIQENYADGSLPVVRSLLTLGVATANELGIGFRAKGHGALLGAASQVSSIFFTLGPPRRGDFFETTAVPEIRVEAEALARQLMSLEEQPEGWLGSGEVESRPKHVTTKSVSPHTGVNVSEKPAAERSTKQAVVRARAVRSQKTDCPSG